jgi:iron complex outermembrane receptor protein
MNAPRRNRLTTAVQLSLLLAWPGLAAAQDAAPPAAKTLDTVTVTGTRIKKAEMEGTVPVQVLTREDIDRSGFTSVADIVQNLTASGSALNTKFNSSGNFGFPPDGGGVGAGSATVDLRNLGSKRTLVLVDGIRWVNESSASGVGSSVDLNTIPLAIIERIEILEDGASSIYGSDAIAGVVNIITRKKADGGMLNLHYGEYDEGDGQTYGADFGWGGSSDRAQWFLGGSYYKQEKILAADRDISQFPVPGTGLSNGSSATPFGRFVFQDPNTGTVYSITPNAGATDPTYTSGEPACPTTRTDDFHCFTTADRFNFALYNLLLTPSERKSVFGQVQFEFSPAVSGHAKLLYNERDSANQAAPEPIFLGTDAGVFNHWAETDLVIAANNPYNPFGFDLTTMGPNANLFLLGRRPVEGGPRLYQQEVKTWYANAGLEGVFDVGDRAWSWDANVVRSESKADQTNTGSYNIKRINQALGDVNACLAIPGCVPLNLFGGPGSITPEMLGWIQPIIHDHSENKFTSFSANLTGDLFDMPAGAFSFATGYEYRKYEGMYQPDPLTVAGEYNGVPSGATSGSYDVNEAYVEVNVPLAKDSGFAKAFDVSMAARYSDYSTFGSETTTKFGFRWQVVDELLLRGSVAEGFRAPSIGELYGTFSRFDATLTDPCSGAGATNPNCVADGVPPGYTQDNPQISVVTAGNRNLQPETSNSFMLGGVWSPAFAENKAWSEKLDLGVTYYNHEVKNAIQAPDAQTILNRCVADLDPVSCAAYTRNNRGVIVSFNDILDNLGTIKTDGWDVDLGWALPEAGWGKLRFDWKNTFVGNYELINEAGAREPRRPGRELNDSAIPEWTSTLNADWRLGDWGVAWTVRHISDLTESCGGADGFPICDQSSTNAAGTNSLNRLGAVTYHDLQVSWRSGAFLKGLELIGGVNNLTDKDPPVCLSCSLNGYDASTYDLPGRFWYVRANLKF